MIQEPTCTEEDMAGGRKATKMTHPSFGMISVSRVSGRTNLFGSDFEHQNYVVITINDADLHRDLSRDWVFPRKQVIEVAMSEAQWATFVSSFNSGGVPCTQTWTREQGILPRLPKPKSRTGIFKREIEDDLVEALSALDDLSAAIAAGTSGISKKKQDALNCHIRTARSKLTSAIPFVVEQFNEHMEEGIEKAKVEIHSYANQLFQRAGVEALAGQSPVDMAIEDKTK